MKVRYVFDARCPKCGAKTQRSAPLNEWSSWSISCHYCNTDYRVTLSVDEVAEEPMATYEIIKGIADKRHEGKKKIDELRNGLVADEEKIAAFDELKSYICDQLEETIVLGRLPKDYHVYLSEKAEEVIIGSAAFDMPDHIEL